MGTGVTPGEGPGHDMTPVEVAAATLAGNAPGTLAEWKAALLAGLSLGFKLGPMVGIAPGFQTPEEFGRALRVARQASEVSGRVHVPQNRRLLVESWPEGFGPKSREGDR
jgi:hypothetical protein